MSALCDFFNHQLDTWQIAKQRFEDLKNVEQKKLGQIKAQFNPARMVSTGAKVDKAALAKRPCFLCAKNRPEEQIVLEFNDSFDVLINPFPILPVHFTLPSRVHELQKIAGKFADMLHFVDSYPEVLVFYNGPKCGASAPDHLHFQAGTKEVLPIFCQWNALRATAESIICPNEEGDILFVKDYVVPVIAIVSSSIDASEALFNKVYNVLPQHDDDIEPMMNVVAWKQDSDFVTLVFPRRKHRPDCYFAGDGSQLLVSPGAIDMAGLLVMPRKEDFERITPQQAMDILQEVSMPFADAKDILYALKRV